MSDSDNGRAYLAEMARLLPTYFNLEELQGLCLELGVDYESLGGNGKAAKARELVLHQARSGRLAVLRAAASRRRPAVDWPEVPSDFDLAAAVGSSEDDTGAQAGPLPVPATAAVAIVAVVAIVAIALAIVFLGRDGDDEAAIGPTPTVPSLAASDIGLVVAGFTTTDDIDPEDVAIFTSRFAGRLDQELKAVLDPAGLTHGLLQPPQVAVITGDDAGDRAKAAATLAETHQADIVIYGAVSRDPVTSRAAVQPEFYVSPASFQDALEVTGSFRFGQPLLVNEPLQDAWEAEDILAARTVALAQVVAGLTQFGRANYEGALAAIDQALDSAAWESAAGQEVVYLLLGNTRLRLAQQAASQCNRVEVLAQTGAAATDYQQAVTLDGEFARAYNGLASGAYLTALWQAPENDGCAAQRLDLAGLAEALDWLDQGQAALEQPREPAVASRAIFNRLQVLFGLWNNEGAFDAATYQQYYDDFWRSSERILRTYESGDVPALGPMVAETYALRGNVRQTEGECRRALEEYDAALAVPGAAPERRMVVLGWQGECYLTLGQPALAAEQFTAALELARAVDDSAGQDFYSRAQATADAALAGETTAEVTAAPAASPTPVVGQATASLVNVRMGAPPNTLQGVSFGLGGALGVYNNEKCNDAPLAEMDPPITGIVGVGLGDPALYPSGELITLDYEAHYHRGEAVDNAFAFPAAPYLWAWEGFVAPRICSAMPVEAVAVAPDGRLVRPSQQYYRVPASEEWEEEQREEADRFILRLPLEAYAEPGRWQLQVTSPFSYSIDIDVPQPAEPFYLREGERFVLMGFEPDEVIAGVVFGSEDYVFQGDFQLQADEAGTAFVELTGINGPVFFSGQAGSYVSNVSANWYEPVVWGSDFGDLLYRTYWAAEGEAAAGAEPGEDPSGQVLTATVTLGELRVYEGTEAYFYPNPNRQLEPVLTLPEGSEVTLIGRTWDGRHVQLDTGENHWTGLWQLDIPAGDFGGAFLLPITRDDDGDNRPLNLEDFVPAGTLEPGPAVSQTIVITTGPPPNGYRWRLDGTAGETVFLTARTTGADPFGLGAGAYAQLDLYRPEGELLATGQIDWPSYQSQLLVTLPADGPFELVARPYGYLTNPLEQYRLQYHRLPPGTSTIQGWLAFGDRMSSQIDESGRATWLFAGASGDQIALAVEAAEPLDTVGLFGPDGALLAEATEDQELVATLNMDGWYGLRLDGRPGSEYQLHLAAEPALPCTESCPDLHYGETINGHLAAGELFVMLDFVGHTEDEVVVRVEDGADKRWMVQLFGPDAERVPCQPLMAESTVLCSLVADGRHLAVLSPASNETEAAFDIQLEASRP